jgi:hypothetical protein
MFFSPRSLLPLLLPSAAALGLASGSALALSSEELVSQAQAACLAAAAKAGWPSESAKLLGGKALDGDKAEVVLELRRDGSGSARLTCPFSASKGLLAPVAAGMADAVAGGGAAGKDLVASLEGNKAPETERESPYIAAQEGDAAAQSSNPVIKQLEGTVAPGSERESPYAAAKEDTLINPQSLGRLWGLVVPLALATGSYLVLRRREGDGSRGA